MKHEYLRLNPCENCNKDCWFNSFVECPEWVNWFEGKCKLIEDDIQSRYWND